MNLEERLFWWLYKRWRHRATSEQLVRHREWLLVDIHAKGGHERGGEQTLEIDEHGKVHRAPGEIEHIVRDPEGTYD